MVPLKKSSPASRNSGCSGLGRSDMLPESHIDPASFHSEGHFLMTLLRMPDINVDMDEYVDDLSLFLQRIRETRGLTRAELGRRAQLSANVVAELEEGERAFLPRGARRRIARALGIHEDRIRIRERNRTRVSLLTKGR